jgi:membrane-associated phospholipid phosphatase
VWELIQKYKHAWILSYLLIYFYWFFSLEQRTGVPMKTIHITLDDYIPFNEWFYIPYVLWFGYIFIVVAYFFLFQKEDYYKTTSFLFIGMTICLLVYTFWPNCQDLRPTVFERDNLLVYLVKRLYRFDTSTNVCPSIHVFNSLVVHTAVMNSSLLKEKKWIRRGSFVLMVLICMSTVFLKQHSVFDGVCAFGLYLTMYPLVYKVDYSRIFESKKKQEALAKY